MSTWTPEQVRAAASSIKQRHGLDALDLAYDGRNSVSLSLISVPKDRRRSGVGTAAMRDVVALVDAHGWTLTGTPDTCFGSSKAGLLRFYRQFGFVPNAGRRKDFTISDTMIRRTMKA